MKKNTLRFFVFVISTLMLCVVMSCSKQTDNEENLSSVNSNINHDYFSKFGITNNTDSVSFVDGFGENILLKKNPKRVVVLQNSLLELWMLTGGNVVGIIKQNKNKKIEGIENATIVGGITSPSLEKIISLKPDLVIISKSSWNRKIGIALKELEIPVFFVEQMSRNDYTKIVRLFTALNNREDMFQKYAIDINTKINDMIKKIPENSNKTVLLLHSSRKAIKVRTSNTFVGEMLKDLKATNTSDKTCKDLDIVSMEKIIIDDPDFIFLIESSSAAKADVKKRIEILETNPAWSELSAIKNKRYIVLPTNLFMYKPNQKYYDAYLILAKYLYPEIFGSNKE